MGKLRSGKNAIAKFKPEGGATEITLKNSDWTLNEKANIKEGPNTSDGMLREAGLEDYEGTIKGWADPDAPIEVNVKSGTKGRLKLYRNKADTTFFDMDIIIGDLKIATGAGDLESWEFPYMKQSGELYTPANPRPTTP